MHQLHAAQLVNAVLMVNQDVSLLIEQRDQDRLNSALSRVNDDLDLADDIFVVLRVRKDRIEVRVVVDIPAFSPQLFPLCWLQRTSVQQEPV